MFLIQRDLLAYLTELSNIYNLFIYLFTYFIIIVIIYCSLFDDAVSNSVHIASDD
jgi:hypothetical protein